MSIELRHSHLPIAERSVHVVEAGDAQGRSFLFLHGWPESWRTWEAVMGVAGDDARLIAVDLPGIGESAGAVTGGSKSRLAEVVHELVQRLNLTDVTLVGHDVGGMAAYAYLRQYDDVAGVVIMNTVIPGVAPWNEMLANPYIWHFGFHAVPALPETLVQGHQVEYFSYFYDALSVDAGRITPHLRTAHAAAYASDTALTAGFDFYRAFAQDARDNTAFAKNGPIGTPLLYLRGEGEGGDIATYARGFRDAGIDNLVTALVPDAGHFTQEEAPAHVWKLISDFATSLPARR
ncbi:pimeloyl-ACP methyl ester carboxylesterase [Nonomuraea polychroma]|uniref:Pimeloyl-ACP methyl ester carboxylesterase n=1 Tax=Nonomuraea polychroma TaxID=46176 RepID=A0A438M384_9ACTN|nr:alpha/beta hydrolase [Nonomuraea polychroma]RVX40290.1 pimeloyl-ACP methyl ester carboxylesterase [Nonomuraea polychroma]